MNSTTNPPRFDVNVIRALRIRYLLLIDLLLIGLAVVLAATLRHETWAGAWAYLQMYGGPLLLVAPLVRLPLYYALNLYNRLWRYASIDDLRSILAAGAIAPVGIALVNFGLLANLGLPYSYSRSIWLLEGLCSLALLAASRYGLRVLPQRLGRQGWQTTANAPATETALIVGAGDAGAMVVRELQRSAGQGIRVVGFVDDNASKRGNVLLGVPILGDRQDIPALVRQHGVRQVIIAMPTAPGKVIREVVRICEEVQIRPRIVPSIHALVNGSLSLSQLRPVEIDDLLRREPIQTDSAAVRALLQNKRVLVTGGGGSIGSELCRQILQCAPSELIILGHGENSVFEIEQELHNYIQTSLLRTRLSVAIADIRMSERVMTLFAHHRPEVVFHAAAHKHVPLMEANPGEAVTNNIIGTQNVLNAALASNVGRFVMISSDKAVNPTSVMGASKRGAELLLLDNARRSGKPYVAVRFGNVLGSRGSVVLTFKRQIAAGGPVTVTHPDVKRYFMTIPEAVQLVLQAAVLGQGGEVFMLDMGDPVRIVDLARDLIRLSGLEEGRDIDIEFTGMRPGEKMYEDLFLKGEVYHTTAHPKIRIAADAGHFVPADLEVRVKALAQAAQQVAPETIRQRLGQLVPEYQAGLLPTPAPLPALDGADRTDELMPLALALPSEFTLPTRTRHEAASD